MRTANYWLSGKKNPNKLLIRIPKGKEQA